MTEQYAVIVEVVVMQPLLSYFTIMVDEVATTLWPSCGWTFHPDRVHHHCLTNGAGDTIGDLILNDVIT
jgi:hypothetical protein